MQTFFDERKQRVINALKDNYPIAIQKEFVRHYFITLCGNSFKAIWYIFSWVLRTFWYSHIPLFLFPKEIKEEFKNDQTD